MPHTYKQSTAVVAREIAGETLLVPITGNLADMQEIYALDEVSAFTWKLLDGSHGLADIVTLIVNEFDVSAETAQADVETFVADLCDRGLVEPA